jgi:EmrB/QacA subfamily drug resistance transporter
MNKKSPSVEKWTLIAAILGSSMVFIDFSTLNIALPAIQQDLNISGKNLLWIINSYAIFLASLMLVGGSLGDIYGRKKIFIIGIIIFSIASFACGISGDIDTLIIARAFQGIGGAFMVPGSLSIISSVITPERRGRAFGTWSTFSALTVSAGPVLGGWLAGMGLWRVIFFLNLPLAVITVIVLIACVPESRDRSSQKLDVPGAVLATIGLTGISYAFLEASDNGFGNIKVITVLSIGVLALVSFLITEKKSTHPMMPLKLFKSKTFSGVNVLTLFMYTALNASLFFLPLNLVQVQGYPEETAGLAILPFAVLISVLSRFSGAFSDKFGARKPLITGPLIAGAGLFLLTIPGLTDGPSQYWNTYFPGILLLGLGMGIIVAPLTAAVMSAVPSHNTGIASGINNTMARIAGLLAIAVLGTIIIISFRNSLESNTDGMNISSEKRTELLNNSNKLAETKPPDGLSVKDTRRVNSSIKRSFVNAFDLIIMISVILSILSSVTAFYTVEKRILKNLSDPHPYCYK